MKILILKIFLLDVYRIILGHLKDLGEDKSFNNSNYRISRGEDALIEEFPFLVQFLNLGGLCAGTIMTRKTVLTAAHCLDVNTNVKEMMVFAQCRYVFDRLALSYDVFDFVKHEDYNKDVVFSHDIAVLMIVDSFQFNVYVNKAIMTDNVDWMKETEKVQVAGWGDTKYGVNRPDPKSLLKATTLHYMDLNKCEETHGTELSEDMFCLYSETHQDTCRGDSGGGVVWNGTVIGIVSHGRGCGEVPAVYANVFYFRPWISKTVSHLNYKFCSEMKKKEGFEDES